MARPKPCPVVLPIPHRHRTEISTKSNLWHTPQGYWQDPTGTLRANGYRISRGACYARPCAFVSEHSTQVQCGECCRTVERESRHPHSSRIPGAETQLHRATFRPSNTVAAIRPNKPLLPSPPISVFTF